MNLRELYLSQGAALAPDGIPLQFGDLRAEYHAALSSAVLMDRSHEGRLALTGRDRLAIPHRMSTNDLMNLVTGEGRATVFTSPNARIIDRALIYNRGDEALVLGEAGRGPALMDYLGRNVFFGDQIEIADLAPATRLFALHGPRADRVIEQLGGDIANTNDLRGSELVIAGTSVYVARRKPISGAHWAILTPCERVVEVWGAVKEVGAPHGLIPAGSLAYNVLRVCAGYPGIGRELSLDYIPLEVGLWDEVSFTKGCYTGQEIIARMESRGRLARTIVRLELAHPVESPAEIFRDGRRAGTLTSSVVSPDGDIFGLSIVKTRLAQPGLVLAVGEPPVSGRVIARAGVQPEHIAPEESTEA